jgi:hypothetical protein
VEDRLRGRDHDDQVGLDEGAMDADVAGLAQGQQVGVGRVVDQHGASKLARTGRGKQPLEVTAWQSASEPSGHEDRLPLVGHAELFELVDDCCERLPSRVDRGSGDGECGWFDDDRGATRTTRRHGERRVVEREAHGVADGRLRVDDAGRRGWGAEDDRVVVDGHVDDARA